jgi:rhodanese-related sulfurtransferase
MNPFLKEIEPVEAKKWQDAGEVVLIDVRELMEYNEEHIAKAHLFPISTFKPDLIPDPAGKKLLFYCHLGRRSANAAVKWGEYAAAHEVYSLKGGIVAWKKSGLPIVIDSAISNRIERQAYSLSGFLVLLGVILAFFISEWFLILPVAIAILLIISGILGHSLLSFLLSMLPWNR